MGNRGGIKVGKGKKKETKEYFLFLSQTPHKKNGRQWQN